jgi:hypothetical protein
VGHEREDAEDFDDGRGGDRRAREGFLRIAAARTIVRFSVMQARQTDRFKFSSSMGG